MIARNRTVVASAEARSPADMATANPHSPHNGPHMRDGNGWMSGDDGTWHSQSANPRRDFSRFAHQKKFCADFAPDHRAAIWLSAPHEACQPHEGSAGGAMTSPLRGRELVGQTLDDLVQVSGCVALGRCDRHWAAHLAATGDAGVFGDVAEHWQAHRQEPGRNFRDTRVGGLRFGFVF